MRRSARTLIVYVAACAVVGFIFISSPHGHGFTASLENARRLAGAAASNAGGGGSVSDVRSQALSFLTAVQNPDPSYKKENFPQHWDYTGKQGFNGGYMWYTETKLRELTACAVRNDCHPNAYKVVIFSGWYCHETFFRNFGAGEGTWCKSMKNSLDRQGYTVLLARDNPATASATTNRTNATPEYAYHIYRQIPDLVVGIIGDTHNGHGNIDRWFKSPERPDGIPAWKFFHFGFFGLRDTTVVGNKWIVSALPNWHKEKGEEAAWTWLGYDLPLIDAKEVVPFEERPHRVWILAKDLSYFYDLNDLLSWPLDFFERATQELRQKWPDFEFVGSFNDRRFIIQEHQKDQTKPKLKPREQPKGIVALGGGVGGEEGTLLSPAEFRRELSNSRVMLGIGRPTVSPSPYEAMMLGVPFINPYWPGPHDPNGTDHSSTWHWTQHTSLHFEKPPHVYNALRNSYESFIETITAAMETPCPPKRMEWVSEEAQDKRMREFMEFDWRSLAAGILEERLKGNETQLGKGPWLNGRHIPEKPGLFEL
ncbi:uncharacterized protein LOC62_01G001057 [Vanrija pseudolonga]|uniref:Uncharacterized protein n=1 Tax=Vanrija pseudolonga TaxID=143232 RepID=A0AAF0Y058_9TREE|nr:hypothetical protein LOC62_01G001057 [Vanrija pseudolonga]